MQLAIGRKVRLAYDTKPSVSAGGITKVIIYQKYKFINNCSLLQYGDYVRKFLDGEKQKNCVLFETTTMFKRNFSRQSQPEWT